MLSGQVSTFQNSYNATNNNTADNGEGIISLEDGFLLTAIVLCKDSLNAEFLCSVLLRTDTIGNLQWKRTFDNLGQLPSIITVKDL